ncbi:MAG: zinc ribbon domain-containing protein [Promethearchaeota archaeon]
MSTSNLESNWLRFGKSLGNIGVCLILIFIPYLAFLMHGIQFILSIVIINEMNTILHHLKDPSLEMFRSKYLAASIIKLGGSIILNIASALLVAVLVFNISLPYFPYYIFGPLWRYAPIIVLFIIGFISMIIGSSIEAGAWTEFKKFLTSNKQSFFTKKLESGIEAVEKLHTGAFLWAIGFLIIPIIIGWIYQIMGYFRLAEFTKLGLQASIEPIPIQESNQKSSPEQQYVPVMELETNEAIKFCPMCGAKVEESGHYCGECGSQIRD